MKSKKTTHIRVYKTSLDEVKLRFPNVRMADFFDMTVRTNPFIQAEASLRKKNVRKKR